MGQLLKKINNQQQGFYPQAQQIPQKQSHHQQKLPFQNRQKIPINHQQNSAQYNMHGGFPKHHQLMPNQFRGGYNQVFRARKKEAEDDECDMDFEENINEEYNYYDNHNVENDYFYPSSAKKYRSNKKMYGQYPMQKKISLDIENQGLTRNLSFCYKKNIPIKKEMAYINNSPSEYINMDNAENFEYYEYPTCRMKNMIPSGRTKKENNHRIINVKVTRNIPYQYQVYQDYEEFIDF